jgi:hypothetical protein
MALQIPLWRGGSPWLFRRLTAADTAHLPGDAQVDGNLTVEGILATDSISGYNVISLRTVDNENAGSIVIGQPVYIKPGEPDDVDLAQADDEATSTVAGLVFDTSISAGQPGDIITSGFLEATTTQWDAVTGQSGGLTAGALYYLDPNTAGMLTATEPTNDDALIAPVGLAFTTTEMLVRIHKALNTAVAFQALQADEDIYVDTAGDDTTGDGSIGNPYLTIHRASEHYARLVPGEHQIIVHINEGVHAVSSTFSTAYPYGPSLRWEGEAENIATPTISNIDASATTGSAPYTALEFIDFDLDLSAASSGPEVGWFVRLTACANGTNPGALNGLAEIVAEAAGVATCRMWRGVGTTEIPSGAITVASVTLLKSVLDWTGNNVQGLDMKGPIDLGDWDGIVLRGGDSAVSGSKRAIRLFNGAGIRASSVSNTFGLFMYEWAVATEVVGGSQVYLLRSGIAKMTSTGHSAEQSGIRLLGTSTINGVVGVSLQASNNSSIDATSIVIQSVNTAGSGVPALAQTGGFINVASASISFDQGAGTALFARDVGRIHAQSATVTGFTNTANITLNTLSADGSFINTN